MTEVYQRTLEDIKNDFDASPKQGLSSSEVEKRREKYGVNEIETGEGKSDWEILLDNLNNIIVYLLGFAALLSLVMGDYIEMIAILLAVAISVFTGFFVERKAKKSVDSLKDAVTTTAKVLRDGNVKQLSSTELVPGDILIVEEGDAVAADARLFKESNLAVIESTLTGESEPVEKDADALFDDEEAVGDQINMIFSSTAVTRGNGRAIVTGTGMDTQVGKISELMQGEESVETPLDKEISKLGKILIGVAFAAAILVLIIGLISGRPLNTIIQISIILAVAAIPEAMPAVQTITLSRGMQIMADHKALVKNLSSVETLGSTSVIASDKTGTLTENQMMVQQVTLHNDEKYKIDGKGYQPKGNIIDTGHDDVNLNIAEDTTEPNVDDEHESLYRLIRNGLLGSTAQLTMEDSKEDFDSDDSVSDSAEYSIVGDPTDGALVVLASKINLDRKKLRDHGWVQTGEIPFQSENKYSAMMYDGPVPKIVVKGAVDVVLDLAYEDQDARLAYWQEKNEELAGKGMRVIAIGQIEISSEEARNGDIEELFDNYISRFNINGLFGIIDPPRQDVKDSIAQTQSAGIDVKMITGDHPKTASVIAEQIGLNNADKTMTGKEIDEAVKDKESFAQKVQETAVFARVSPENKLQIVNALQEQSEIVSMTGDGVNDAPALNGADIGVAMGVRGTEVAKDASDMILTDDRFSTIVNAVEVGRVIFANIKKYVSFLFACNMVEIMAVLLTLVFGLPMPIAPLHILFLNLLIDIGPAIALAYEPKEDEVMEHEPRDPKGGLVNPQFLTRIIIAGIVIGISAFIIFYITINTGVAIEYAQTATFTFMAVAQLMHIFNVRKLNSFGLDTSYFKNKLLVGAMIFSVILQLIAVYTPFMNTILTTVPLAGVTWLWIIGIAIVATGIVYLIKSLAVHED